MKKLYMISIGGKAEKANIEVHDVQFVIADTVEDVIPVIKENWYGRDFKLHMDSYKAIEGIPGWKIEVTTTPQQPEERLFFAYLGGYLEDSTQEVHKVRLLTGPSLKSAKANALTGADFNFLQPHVDTIVDVEESLLSADGEKYWLRLTKDEGSYDLTPEWFGYRRLDA